MMAIREQTDFMWSPFSSKLNESSIIDEGISHELNELNEFNSFNSFNSWLIPVYVRLHRQHSVSVECLLRPINRYADREFQRLPDFGVVMQNGGAAIQEVGAADILVGIPTYNNADTIVPLVNAARNGALRYPEYRTVIMQADGGSDDSTLTRARDALNGWSNFIQTSYPLYPVHKLAVSAYGDTRARQCLPDDFFNCGTAGSSGMLRY